MFLKKLLVFLFITLIWADEGKEHKKYARVSGYATGSTEKGTKVKARLNGLTNYIRQKIDVQTFILFENKIKSYLLKNWRTYCTKKDEKFNRKNRKGELSMLIRSHRLISDIHKYIPEIRIISKIKGLQIALVQDNRQESYSRKSKDLMLDHCSSQLGKIFTILDPESAKALNDLETKSFDLNKNRYYQDNIWREFDQIHAIMFFSIDVQKNNNTNIVTIHARGIERMTAQQLFRFNKKLEGHNLDDTIKKICEKAVDKIIHQIAMRKNVFPKAEYEIKFLHFSKKEERDNIRNALFSLRDEKFLTLRPGGFAAGENYFTQKISWQKKDDSLPDIIESIKEYCETEGVEVECNKHSLRLFIFQSPGSDWDHISSPNTSSNSIHSNKNKFSLSPSPNDKNFIIEKETINMKNGERMSIPFRWPKHAPKKWYFYSLLFANEEEIYLIFPNVNINSKILSPGTDYIFPDLDEYMENWGIEIKESLAEHLNKDTDKVMLIATSHPVNTLAKKMANLEQGVATLTWQEFSQAKEDIEEKNWASKVIFLNITRK